MQTYKKNNLSLAVDYLYLKIVGAYKTRIFMDTSEKTREYNKMTIGIQLVVGRTDN